MQEVCGHIPTVGFQSMRFVSEPEEGFHRRIQISGFSGKSGKIEPLSPLAPERFCIHSGKFFKLEGDMLLAYGPGENRVKVKPRAPPLDLYNPVWARVGGVPRR